MDDDIVRILVSTDNHLGFAERDPVRCDDCFAAFEEVLATARRKKVDFVLLAGDMFHENRPSRRTLHNTMELLRKYCLGEDPVYTAILNDQKEIFKSSFGRVNYEDPYQSVCLPVFSIHGNHDDPSREGGNGEALAALDLLAVGNLINYFGKADRVEDIEITPILIKKGNTNLAIYGLGAIRDERLNRMWNQKKVKFVRLTEEQGREDFFNIFVLHQNRDYGRGAKNCVHESMIPEWMDLVIWGNEHECQPQLTESLVGTYRILQPGSSIASSYSSTESSQCPKHMAFFEIKEKKFRMRAIKYKQVRSFLYKDVSLRDYPHLDSNNVKIEENIKDLLITKINEMILEGRSLIDTSSITTNGNNSSSNLAIENNTPSNTTDNDNTTNLPATKFQLRDPHKVLIRLRVDHEGFPSLNQQRFGSYFMNEIANPADIILFIKKRKEIIHFNSNNEKKIKNSAHEDFQKILAEGEDDQMSKIKIEDLVNETLASSNHTLSLLAETEMAQALDDYIIKKQPNAIMDMVVDSLKRTQKALHLDKTASTEDKAAILKATSRVKEKAEETLRKEIGKKMVNTALKSKFNTTSGGNNEDVEDDHMMASNRNKSTTNTTTTSRGNKSSFSARSTASTTHLRSNNQEEEEEEEDDDFSVGEVEQSGVQEGEGMEVDSDDEELHAKPKGRGRTTAAAGSSKAKTSTNSTTAGKRASTTTAAAAKKTPVTKKSAVVVKESPAGARTSKRAAATKAVVYAAAGSDSEEEEEEGDFEEEDEEVSAAERGGGRGSGRGSESEEDDELVGSDSQDGRRRQKKKSNAPAAAASKAKKAATTATRKPSAASSKSKFTPTATTTSVGRNKRQTARDVIDLDSEEEEEYPSENESVRRGTGSSTTTKKTTSTAKATTTARGRSAASAVCLDDDIEDDEGFMRSGAVAETPSYATQQSTVRLPGATAGKKRQLPLSFSQSVNPSQSFQQQSTARKTATNRSMASAWDE